MVVSRWLPMAVLQMVIIWCCVEARISALDIPHGGLDMVDYILHESNFTDYKGNKILMLVFQPRLDKFVSYSLLNDGVWEGQLNKLYQTLLDDEQPTPDMITLDLGANLGAFSLFAASLGRKIYSFEMQPDIHRLLELSRRLNGYDRMKTFHAALWSDKGKEVSFTPLKGNRGGTQVSSHTEGSITMTTTRADEYIKDKVIFFLKIDVENSEEQVLQGLDGHLAKGKIKHLVIEIRKNQGHIIKWLYQLGFRCGYFSRRKLFNVGTIVAIITHLVPDDYLDLYCKFIGPVSVDPVRLSDIPSIRNNIRSGAKRFTPTSAPASASESVSRLGGGILTEN